MTGDLEELLRQCDAESKDYIILVYCLKGGMQVELDGRDYKVAAQELLVCLPSLMVGKYMRTPDFECRALCVGHGVMEQFGVELMRSEVRWLEKLRYITQYPVIHMNPYQQELINGYFNLLRCYMKGAQDEYRRQIIHLLARAATCEVLSYLDDAVSENMGSQLVFSQKDVILRNYLSLLNQPNMTNREVSYFAEALNITPKYLTTVCKERSGRSASQWIALYKINEVKRLLTTTDKSIKEVAFEAGFSDVSFFCQYVRKHTGKTPLAIRKGK